MGGGGHRDSRQISAQGANQLVGSKVAKRFRYSRGGIFKAPGSCQLRVRSIAPYLLIELLMPGGTLVAAALYFLCRRGMMVLKMKRA